MSEQGDCWAWTIDPDGCEGWQSVPTRDEAITDAIGALDDEHGPVTGCVVEVWISPAKSIGPADLAEVIGDGAWFAEWLTDRIEVDLEVVLPEMPADILAELARGVRDRVEIAMHRWGARGGAPGVDGQPGLFSVRKPKRVRVRVGQVVDGCTQWEEVDA